MVYVPRKNFLSKDCEYGRLSCATIPEFLKLFLRVVFICAGKKERRFWGEAGTGYLTRESNKVKLWQQWSGFLLVDCCGWVIILVNPAWKSVGDQLLEKVGSVCST